MTLDQNFISSNYFVLAGSHTGHIQAIGGSGDMNSGGGGSGGRVALYHSRHETIPLFRGYFDVYGGKPGSNAEAGASGTAYVQDDERDFKYAMRITFLNHFFCKTV